MKVKIFSRDETSLIKGIAILLIVFHNFFHWIYPFTGENEFNFDPIRIQNFFYYLITEPYDIINVLFSYLGHYGVQLFVFISGFGLALSFSRRQRSWGSFMIERLKKIYPLLIVGLIFFVFATILIDKRLLNNFEIDEIRLKLLFLQTLYPSSGLSVNGPWWFFALIMQLYVLFPVLYYVVNRANTNGLLALLILSYTWIYLSEYLIHCQWDVLLLQNAPGHIPEFVFGIWFALNKDKKINNVLCLVALALFVLGNFYKLFFPLTFLSFTILFLWMIVSMINNKRHCKGVRHFLIFIGSISMVVFAIHGSFRLPFVYIGESIDSSWGRYLSALLYFSLVIAISIPAEKIYNYFVSLLDRIHLLFNKLLSKIPRKEMFNVLISRIIQLVLIYIVISLVVFYIYKPKYSQEGKEIYQGHFSIELADEGMFNNITEDGGNYYIMIGKDNLYSALMPNIEIEKSYGIMEASISFDVSFSDSIKVEYLPKVVFSCGKDLWKSEEMSLKSDSSEWRRVEIQTQLLFRRNPRGKILKVYLWNKDKQTIKYDNIDINIHY